MTTNMTPREYGNAANVAYGYNPRRRAREHYAGTPEPTPELVWPYSVPVYDQMERSDGQVSSLIRACTLPIYQARWHINGEGCRPEVARFVRQQLGLPDPDEAFARTSRTGVKWGEHLKEALKNMLVFGHMPFEQVYEVIPSEGSEHEGLFAGRRMVTLKKLAGRHPRTLKEIAVKPDGGLVGIRQHLPEGHPWMRAEDGSMIDSVFIPVSNLVMYVLDREGAEWTGRSLLRSAYKHWFIKEHLIRLDAQITERNGMGVPFYEYDPQVETPEEAERIVEEFRAGERAGIAAPVSEAGRSRFSLVGVSGSTVDPIPKIQYHDQAISKSGLTMFLDLGHDSGARSLGDTFVDFFTGSLQSVADDVAQVATEHIVRDLVALNFGPNEPYPTVEPGNLAETENVSVATLTSLTNAGLITPDSDTENVFRRRYALPERDAEDAAAGTDPVDLNTRMTFVATAIRSGFDPAEAMRAVGLDPIEHLGLLPVTVQPPAAGTDLDNAVPPVDEADPAAAPVSSGPFLPASRPAASAAEEERLARLEALLDRVERLRGDQ